MIAVLLLQYDDAQPSVKPHIYSHTSYVTLSVELFYLRMYPLVLNNLMTPAKLAQIWEVMVTWGGNTPSLRHVCGWYALWTISYIHIRHIKSVWVIGMLSQGHMGAPLYRYTSQVGTRFGDSRSLVECKNCAITSQLSLISTTDCYPHPY